MTPIGELVPPPPRPMNRWYASRVRARFSKFVLGTVLFLLGGCGLISSQFFAPDPPILSRVAMSSFGLLFWTVAWFLWRTGSKECREALEAWETWSLAGMKPEKGMGLHPVDPSALDFQGILAGRVKDEYYVLIDPKYRFNRRPLDLEFLQELSKGVATK